MMIDFLHFFANFILALFVWRMLNMALVNTPYSNALAFLHN